MNRYLIFVIVSLANSISATPISTVTNCQPIGPYPYPMAVIPSNNERYIIVSASMHNIDLSSSNKCGSNLNLDALLMIEALLYAKDTYPIRMSQQPGSEPLGLMILDNCADLERTAQDLINFESCTLAFAPQALLGGPMVFPDDAVFYFIVDYKTGPSTKNRGGNELERKLTNANLHHKPIVEISEYDEVSERLIKSMALILRRLTYKNVAVVFSDTIVGRYRWSTFRNLTDSLEICLQSYKFIPSKFTENDDDRKSIDFLKSIAEDQNIYVLVILTDSQNTAQLLGAAKRADLLRRWHWVGFCASLKNIQETIEDAIPPGSIMLARENDLTDFYEYVNAERDVGSAVWASTRNPWLEEYETKIKECNATDCSSSSSTIKFQENQWLQYNDLITDVISAYDAASLAWSDQTQIDNRLESMTKTLRQSSSTNIMILNYRHTSKGWRFVRIGTIRDATDVHLDSNSVQTYMQRPIDNRNSCPDTCEFCDSYKRRALSDPTNPNASVDGNNRESNRIESPTFDFLHRTDLWACLLTGFAASMILMIFIYEVYAVTKICSRLPRVSAVAQSGIFLSQGLLYGVFLQSLSVFSITVVPNFYVCAIQRFMPGIGCVLTYSVMFSKLLVLISARQGQYLAACYQGLVVVLFLAMQTIVSIHWLAWRPFDEAHNFGSGADSAGTNETNNGLFIISIPNSGKSYESASNQGCNLTFIDYLKMLILPLALILLCASTAMVTRKNPYNYRETSFIALASFSNGAIWTVWICLGVFLKRDGLQDAALGYGLLTNAFVVTVIMFLPSSRQKTAIGEGIGLNPEDVLGLKGHQSTSATWTKYFVGGQSRSILSISQQPKKKNAATQSTVRHSKRTARVRPSKSDVHTIPMPIPPSASLHSLTLQKAIKGINQRLNTTRHSGLDPGGSAVTLDIPQSIIQTIKLPPPPPPMALFNSHWKAHMTPKRSTLAMQGPTAISISRFGQLGGPKNAPPPQDMMVYASFGGSVAGELQKPPPLMPKPVFPVLTPAKLVNEDASTPTLNSNGTIGETQEITYAHVCKHSHYSKPNQTPYKPLLRHPVNCLYRSRSSQDFRQCRKRCALCLHSILYRSRSFSEIKNNEIGELQYENQEKSDVNEFLN